MPNDAPRVEARGIHNLLIKAGDARKRPRIIERTTSPAVLTVDALPGNEVVKVG
jgi:hypothetical protein